MRKVDGKLLRRRRYINERSDGMKEAKNKKGEGKCWEGR
jgi:hypothetical protein